MANAKKDVLVLGITGDEAYAAFLNWQGALGFTYDIISNVAGLATVTFGDYKSIFVPR